MVEPPHATWSSTSTELKVVDNLRRCAVQAPSPAGYSEAQAQRRRANLVLRTMWTADCGAGAGDAAVGVAVGVALEDGASAATAPVVGAAVGVDADGEGDAADGEAAGLRAHRTPGFQGA